jgi:hypothetical protein
MKTPHHIHLGGQAGVMLCVELPDGRRVLQAGGVDVIGPDQIDTLIEELQRVRPWAHKTNVIDNRDKSERMVRGVVIGPRREV